MTARLIPHSGAADARRNLLPYSIGIGLIAFATQLWLDTPTLAATGYLLAAGLSLRSTRIWHAAAIAAFGIALFFAAALISGTSAITIPELCAASLVIVAATILGIIRQQRVQELWNQGARKLDDLRRQAAELRDLKRRLESAAASSLEGHWEIDLTTHNIWHSASMRRLLGYEARQCHLSSKEARAQVHPEDVGVMPARFAEHIRTGKPFEAVLRLRTAQGSYRWYWFRGSAELDSKGRPLRAAGSASDIHEQKLAQDALRAAQERFERAARGTQDGLWELDLSVKPARMWLSPRFHEILGYEDGELGDHEFAVRDLIHPDDLEASTAAVRSHLENQTPMDFEVRLRTKSGEYRWCRLRGGPALMEGERALRFGGSMQDVTEARAAREMLILATQTAESANRAKTTFLATVSHEIRTPMNGIIGMAGLLLDTQLTRAQREYVEAIVGSAKSLLAIINDILDFSKIEAGKLEIENIDVDLRAVVEEVGTMLALQTAAKNIELVIDVRPEVPQIVSGDPHRIRQCLINLLSNAIKFTSAGEIVVEVCVLGQKDGKALVHFCVRDTGIGISPEVRPQLFEPFVQEDSSTTRRFGGTGLGLSIVKRLVELMEGDVGVNSEPGKGSAFWFTVPLAPVEPSSRIAMLTQPVRGQRILVVDDNDTSRRVLSQQLLYCGYRVDDAASGADALRRLSLSVEDRDPYQVILVDYQMPDMDGAALGERINSDPRLAGSRLVLLTAVDQQSDHARFAQMGFAACLTKPVRTGELRECIGRVLKHDAQEWQVGTNPILTRTVLKEKSVGRRYSARVLVVEDNIVNQKVAQKFLERFGCSVRLAADGLQAVAAFEEEPFDIIFMDMQMPVMDGVTATREIRSREKDGRRVPIIALTANVLSTHLEACLNAGMDDVLSKPLDVERLREMLDRFVHAVQYETEQPVSTQVASHDTPPLNLAYLNQLAGDDEAFVAELLEAFQGSIASSLNEMRAAVPGPDREKLSRAAHRMKGACDNVGASRLQELTAQLEAEAPDAPAPELVRRVEDIAVELMRVRQFCERAISLAPLKQRKPSPA